MRISEIAFVLCAFCFSSLQLQARVPRRTSRATDPAYSSALAAANHFLHAWQTQDHETGIMMLTDAAREHASRERLQEFFSPGPEAAYEIQHGRRLNSSEYVFRVVLFGLSNTAPGAHAGRIVLTKSGKDDWAVDRLP